MKGFEGDISVIPETKGWGSSVFAEGNYLFADSESLSVGQEFKDRPDKIVFGRYEKTNSRTKSSQKPAGDVEYQFRSDDSLPLLMAHFQKYTGTNEGSAGTTIYTFVPEQGQPDWTGSTFGTGGYTDDPGDIYTVGIVKRFNETATGTDNAIWFKSCIVDQLAFNLEAEEDAKFTASIKAYSVDEGTRIAVTPPNATFGSYSAKSGFESWTGTLNVGGDTSLQITSMTFTSANNSEDRSVIGNLNPTKYDFGKGAITGAVQIDAPNAALEHLGSMVADRALAINGTLWNSSNDYLIFSMPNCKYEPFDVTLAGGNAQTEYPLNFKAFESNDGATSPITITCKTTGMGSAFNKL